MKKSLLFAKRNFKEMVRDPLLYIFCIGFPAVMVVLFQIISIYSNGNTPMFEAKGLIPGIMMFSYSFLMLMGSLLISKDKTTSFLKRLYSSPLKPYNFIIGYFIPLFLIGLIQSIVSILLGYIVSGINNTSFISFGNSILLIIEMLPIMIINIMLGMLFGLLLNDKSAPGITSIFISACGILGGAWMPIDIMGDFEKAAGYLPFYPAVYLGRIITSANHTPTENTIIPVVYTFDNQAIIYIIVLCVYLVASIILSTVIFSKRMKTDRY